MPAVFLEAVTQPGTDEIQLLRTNSSVFATGVVILFTTPRDVDSCLALADTIHKGRPAILLACPVTPDLFGELRLKEFLRLAQRRFGQHTLSGQRVRWLTYYCAADADPVAELLNSNRVVILRRRWWRSWGRRLSVAETLQAGSLTVYFARQSHESPASRKNLAASSGGVGFK